MPAQHSSRFAALANRKHLAAATIMFAAFTGSWWALRPAGAEADFARKNARYRNLAKVDPADRTRLSKGEPPAPPPPGVDAGGSSRPPPRATTPPGNRPRTGAVP